MTDMEQYSRLGSSVELDVCTVCQAFWFDRFKNLQLSPGAILNLMKFISEHPPVDTITLSQNMPCPYCGDQLTLVNDMQRATRFRYWRCENEHGRFIGFVDFLREKDFIRPLSAEQIEDLKQNIQIVNCSHCGAPIDLAKSSSCINCGSPISLLDLHQPQRMLSQLKAEAEPKKIDPNTMNDLALIMVRHDEDDSFALLKSHPDWVSDVTSSSLVHACLSAVSRWIVKM